jgi:uncharacterized protein YecE (DUF72 family)
MIRVGCAGWSLPPGERPEFSPGGSVLQRYASLFPATEINSSFYRPHRESTYARWAEETPRGFRFSVKIPRTITHEHKLAGVGGLLDEFLGPVCALGGKLGWLLVQLPPSLAFDASVAGRFLRMLRARHEGKIALEPRHLSWFTPRAAGLLQEQRIARVAADPPHDPAGLEPGGWTGAAYFRLHGSPRMYWSSYDAQWLDALHERLAVYREAWCIFDNTAARAAVPNAIHLHNRTRKREREEKEPALRKRLPRRAR